MAQGIAHSATLLKMLVRQLCRRTRVGSVVAVYGGRSASNEAHKMTWLKMVFRARNTEKVKRHAHRLGACCLLTLIYLFTLVFYASSIASWTASADRPECSIECFLRRN